MALASHIIPRSASRGLIIATIVSLVVSLIPMTPWQVSAAEFGSAAPAVTVAPSQTGITVLDFTLPAHANQDRVLDADGSATTNVGSASIQPGNQLFPIAASKKIVYLSGSGYEYVWIDRDMSKKYSNDTTLTDHDSEVYWGAGEAWHPDNGAPLTTVGAGFKVIARASTLDWSPTFFALFLDNGTMPGLADPADTRLDATGNGQSNKIAQRNSTFSQDAILARTATAACPTGIAIDDVIRVGAEGIFRVANIEYLTTGGNCYASFSQATFAYSYALQSAITLSTPYAGAITITKLTAIPNQNTTQLTLAAGGGNLKGIAVGDEISIKDAANNTIRFRVDKINSSGTGSLTVTYVAGSLASTDNLTTTVTVQSALDALSTATFFDALAWQPVRLKYADENGNASRDATEPLYWEKNNDVKPNEVSHTDYRVSGVTAETLLFKNGVIPSTSEIPPPNGSAINTALMAAPKIYSETPDWSPGDDIILDGDGDVFYNRDLLTAIQVLNEGTAPRSAVSKVKLYHNGVFVTELSDEIIPGVWEAKNLSEPLLNSGAFTIKADLTASAPNAGTLKFAIVKESVKTTYAALPNDRVRNANAQTVSTGVAVVPEAPPVVPGAPAAPVAGLVEGDIFMVAGAAAGATLYSFENGKKNPYPSASIFLSWFPDFNSVTIKRISEAEVGAMPWGFNARYRPGTRMVKIPEDSKVYAVTPGGKVCWVKDEEIARKFYGPLWNKKIDDMPASLFVGRTNYQHDPACDLTLDSKYPTGTLLRFQQKRYYVDGGTVREITSDGLTRNRFRDEFVIDVPNLTGYEMGAVVATAEFTRVMR